MVEKVADIEQDHRVNWELPPSPFLQSVPKDELDPASISGWGVVVYLLGLRNPVAKQKFEDREKAMDEAEKIAARGVWIGDQIFHPPHKIDRCVVVALTTNETNS